MAARIVLVERKDGAWGWSLYGDNGSDIIATDGGQGYENMAEALEMAKKIMGGHYADAPLKKRIYDRSSKN